MRKVVITGLVIVSSLLSGCAATQMMVKKHNLDVQTKTSASVFLDPVPNAEKVIYVQIKNTSDHPDFNVTDQVVSLLKAKGYNVTNKLNKAHYLLQANILQVGKTNEAAADAALNGGYGSIIGSAATAAGATALATDSGRGILAAGLVGGIGSMIADDLVQDVVYSTITDVQISERTNETVNQTSHSALSQGTSSEIDQNSKSTSHWHRYRTRILSTAEKVNLKFAQALPKLKTGLSNALAGFF